MFEEPSAYTTIERVRDSFDAIYPIANLYTKIALRAWLHYSESRYRNNHHPLTFSNYQNVMNPYEYLKQVEVDVFDCSDLGGKEKVIEFLKSII